MKITYLLCLFLFVFVVGYSFGQTQKELTLSMQQCIELAADSSLQAFRIRNQYQASYWQYKTYLSGRLPLLTLSTIPISYNSRIVTRYDSENDVDVYRNQQSFSSQGSLSLKQNIDFTGGTVFVDSELKYLQNFGKSPPSQFTTVPFRIGYSQPLFGFNDFKWDKKIEPLKYEKAKQEFIYMREEISENVIVRFFNLALAQMEYDLAVENVASTDTLYRIGSERFKIAAISQADLFTLNLDALNAKNTFKAAEAELRRAMFVLASYLNLSKDSKIRVELPEQPQSIDVSVESVLSLSKQNNPNYLQYRQNILEAEREAERMAKSSVFNASISASIGFNQEANAFREAYHQFLPEDMVQIGLNIPLVDWGVRKGKANMARSNLNVVKITTEQSTVNFEQDAIITVSEFSMQQDMIHSAEEARRLARFAYNSTKARFVIGKADINSLTLSLGRLNTAHRNYITALQNYWASYHKLRKLTLFDFITNQSLSYQFDNLLKQY